MNLDISIVVLSNLRKDVGRDIEVVVGLPTRNPMSLPFAHKPIFADRLEQYDLFIYSEDDILISERNIVAFRQSQDLLHKDEIAGFLRTERAPDGTIYFPDVHGRFHWDPGSVSRRADRHFAFFSNEHSPC